MLASTFASMSTTAIFASSEGWPIRRPAIVSHPFMLSAVPAPVPKTSTMASNITLVAYAGQAAHSIKRTDERVTTKALPSATKNQMSCRCHAAVAAPAAMSVCPAEYTMAMPITDNSSAVSSSG